jgi:hypothetical protein
LANKTIYAVETGAPFGEEGQLLALCETLDGAYTYVRGYIRTAKPKYRATTKDTWSDGYYTVTIRPKELLP